MKKVIMTILVIFLICSLYIYSSSTRDTSVVNIEDSIDLKDFASYDQVITKTELLQYEQEFIQYTTVTSYDKDSGYVRVKHTLGELQYVSYYDLVSGVYYEESVNGGYVTGDLGSDFVLGLDVFIYSESSSRFKGDDYFIIRNGQYTSYIKEFKDEELQKYYNDGSFNVEGRTLSVEIMSKGNEVMYINVTTKDSFIEDNVMEAKYDFTQQVEITLPISEVVE